MRRHAIIGALLLIGLGVVLGATVFRTDIAQATGLKQSQSVIVDNTTSQAVPVREQGTVKVAIGDPSAPAEPYVNSIECSTTSSDICISSEAVPEGKRLVIQTVSAGGSDDPGVTLRHFNISVQSNGGAATFSLKGTEDYSDGSHTYSTAETRAVTLYADAGTLIHFGVAASDGGAIGAGLDISGYLVPMPS